MLLKPVVLKLWGNVSKMHFMLLAGKESRRTVPCITYKTAGMKEMCGSLEMRLHWYCTAISMKLHFTCVPSVLWPLQRGISLGQWIIMLLGHNMLIQDHLSWNDCSSTVRTDCLEQISFIFFFTFCINSFICIWERTRQGGIAQGFWTACFALNLWTKQSCEWKLLKLLGGTRCPKKEKIIYFVCACIYDYFKDPRDKKLYSKEMLCTLFIWGLCVGSCYYWP